ncbi:MAG: tetratricopeptide repeat protein [Alphaproteobacteria bacterium]|nr:MAG: tetratricopeptide repeat protein [Alphaproteobacteria bacterium]
MTDLAAAQSLHQQGRWDEAAKAYADLARNGETRAWYLLALLGMQRGDSVSALQALESYLKAHPGDARALHLQGLALQSQAHHRQAAESLQAALLDRPQDALLANALAVSLMAQNLYERAANILEPALSAQPDCQPALGNWAECLRRLYRLDESEAAARRLLALSSGEPEAMNALALVLRDQGTWDEAETLLRGAIKRRPDMVEAHANLGAVLMDRRDIKGAESAYRQALTLNPHSEDIRCDLGMNLLQQRRFEEGWELYESRLKGARAHTDIARLPGIPLWRPGESAQDCRLVVYAEQGFGDTLQFMRLLPELTRRGASVHLRVPPALHRLLAYNLEPLGIEVTDTAAPPPKADRQIPMQSLPLCLGMIDPYSWPGPPYLKAPTPYRYEGNLPTVGLAFSASPKPVNPAMLRRMPASALRGILAVPGIRFVSLQRGEAESMLDGLPIDRRVESARDFADTANITAGLDLVLSVDTVAAHLAGALGRPLWLMANYALDWRWSMAGDGPCPWYPQRRSFHCPSPDGWDKLAKDVAAALIQWRDDQTTDS